ncbi:MAG: hypothetical protein V9E93_19150 [Steroidobacteraceae bacterium]|nr:hypothetical protein [Steroidobacteraceae bacterium]MBP7013004.1 hypothetical protein [Steroidobacteraceae bacterium]
MHAPLSNRHVWWYTLVYLGSIGVLITGGRPLEDVIGAFLILGVLLPLVALAACTRMPKPQPPAPWRRDDGALLLSLLAWIVVFLLRKGPLLTALLPSTPDPRPQLRVRRGTARAVRCVLEHGVVHRHLEAAAREHRCAPALARALIASFAQRRAAYPVRCSVEPPAESLHDL